MVAASGLQLRVAALERSLDLARTAIPVVEDLDPELGRRLAERFEWRVAEAKESVAAIGADAPAESERRLADAEGLIEETLAFLAAAAARKIGLDEGITTFAAKWLDQLSTVIEIPPVAVVIPAMTEVTGMTSSVVRLRVLADGIWGLPVAIHEYGHFVAARHIRREEVEAQDRSVTPVEDLVHSASVKAEYPRLYSHGHELFADALAAAIAGPGYTYYCIRYRFPAATAHTATATHPCPVRRIRTQLDVLAKLAAAASGGDAAYLSGEAGRLRQLWNSNLAAAGVRADIPADPQLDQLEGDIVSLIFDDPRLRRARYTDHRRAWALAQSELETAETPGPACIINAAWSARYLAESRARDLRAAESSIGSLSAAACALLERWRDHG